MPDPADPRPPADATSRRDRGRALAMDSILTDACRGTHAKTDDAAAPHPSGPRPTLRLILYAAASILAIWGLLFASGALRESPKRTDTVDNGTKSIGKIVGPNLPQAGTQQKQLAIPKPDENGKIPIPKSADPEDIKVLRSAQAMLAAEARLKQMWEQGQIRGVDHLLGFAEISDWTYSSGLMGMPQSLRRFDGKRVMMAGFMLPIDEVENMRQFLLVESLWSCCYGTPPDIHQVVRVVMQGDKRSDYQFEPIKVTGTFRVKETVDDGFVVDIFQLETDKVEVLK